jgi:hypothetical protein
VPKPQKYPLFEVLALTPATEIPIGRSSPSELAADRRNNVPAVKARRLAQEVGLEAAKIRGFVVTSSVHHEHHLDYWNWCRKAGLPFIHVRKNRSLASIRLDCETTGYPPTCLLDEAGWAAVWAVIERVGLRRRTRMTGGETLLSIVAVPNAHAEEVAGVLRWSLRPQQ